MRNCLTAALAFLVLHSSAIAATLHVDALLGANTSNCTNAATPCRTISYAMSQAVGGAPGDTILVAPGRYDTALGEVFPITVLSGVVLRSATGAEGTIIDAKGS